MQLYVAFLAFGAAVVTAQGPNLPPTNQPSVRRPFFTFGTNTCATNQHPNGLGPAIGPTDCGQLVRDCNYHGPGQTCTTDYNYIVNCYNGIRYGYVPCDFGTACNAAVDGSGAFCVPR